MKFNLILLFVLSGIYFSDNYKTGSQNCREESLQFIKKGISLLNDGQIDSAITYLKLAEENSKLFMDSIYLVACYNNLGIIYTDIGKFQESLYNFQNAYSYLSDTLSVEACKIILNIGIVESKLGNYEKALVYFANKLIMENKTLPQKLRASFFNEYAIVKQKQNDFTSSIEYFKKSLHLYINSSDEKKIAGVLNNIGNSYKELKKYDKALQYFEKSLKIKKELGSKKHLATTYNNIGNIEMRLKNYKSAEKNFHKSLQLKEKIKNKAGIISSCYLLGELYFSQVKYKKAEDYLLRAKLLAEEINSFDLEREVYVRLKNLYAAQNKGQKALYYYDKYIAVKDSIFNTESMKHMQEMETRYQTREKEQQIKLLHLENSNQELLLQKTRLGNWLLAGFALLLLLSILPVYYFIKQKQNYRLLQERSMAENKECNRISRELHDGVVSNLSYLCRWGEDEQVDGNFIQKLRKVSEEIRGISHQLNVNAIGKLAFRESLIDSLDLEHFPKDIDLKIYLPDDFEVEKYDEKMNWIRIIKELLNNSLKYADASVIQIQFLQNEKSIHFQYQDNGRGVDLQKVKPGNGMQNIEDRVKLLTGKMEMNSELGEGFECVITV